MHVHSLRSPLWRYLIAAGGIGLLTGVLSLFRTTLAPANLVMLYVPAVALIALVAGRRASAVASVLAFLAYNFFFVPPLYTLAVEQGQNVIALVILLAVAMLVGTLVARSRAQAEKSAAQAEQMRALYEVSQEISAALAVEQILPRIAQLALRLLSSSGAVIRLTTEDGTNFFETSAGNATVGRNVMSAPLIAGGKVLGELKVWTDDVQPMAEHEFRPLLKTLATQAALAVERTRLVDAALQTRMLRESERLKGALLSSVSHDLRTPLAIIKGSASDMLDPSMPLDPLAVRSTLTTITAEADRMNRLVRNLLEMSRLEAGAVLRSREPVVLNDIVAAVVARLGPLLAGHHVNVSMPAGLPDVLADPMQIDLVLTNMLENAAKYAPGGTPIEIGAVQAGVQIALWVGDRGPGFPPGTEQRVFEKFYRASARTGSTSGSGLGLAIARGIIEAHGGTIAASTRPDGGACVTFRLPRAPQTSHNASSIAERMLPVEMAGQG
ncbi:MAG: DUF4118 domain-containing protein [Herpetosiphonaceae bacterium]|nr:DUF4118 domain-containing protein [Herpetosiphonaceae bacterium]